MLFNSLHFAVFFPVVTTVYFLLRGRARLYFLLAASAYFYMALIPAYLLILLALVLIDFFAALRIEASTGAARRAWLVASLLVNLSLLFFFKYSLFALEQLAAVLGLPAARPGPAWLWTIALPVGLSFHTFQSMAYTIEVYRGAFRAERDLAVYSLYVLFYPQLVAGPIERPQRLLPELRDLGKIRFDPERASSGLRWMLWGLTKKMVVADSMAVIVDRAYRHAGDASGLALWAGALAFSIQIYCDFSGYTDVARGAARVMGVELVKNFDRPYAAASITDFWRRWHISLSSWFRDYVYLPLGGSRRSLLRTVANVMVVFLLSGLWHGANWTFVVWGGVHGMAVAAVTCWRRGPFAKLRVPTSLGWLATFLWVTLAWIFFRAPSLDVSLAYFSGLLRPGTLSSLGVLGTPSELVWAAATGIAVLGLEAADARFRVAEWLSRAPRAARWAAYYAAVAGCLLVADGPAQGFIYFQF